jgi:hypothetical protein
LALEQLGFGPCCHGGEERHFKQGSAFWDRVFTGAPIDWDDFFHGYRSTVDSPSCKFYLTLATKYPLAAVVLTLRDPNAWFDSYHETVLPMMMSSSQGAKLFSYLFGASRPDRQSMIAAYERHNAEVKQLVPAQRLLVYEVESGWKPLCEFLGVPVPDTPFPHSNVRTEFAEKVDELLTRLAERPIQGQASVSRPNERLDENFTNDNH